MAQRKIVTTDDNNPVLRQKARKVHHFDASLKRLVDVEDVANTVDFLLSDGAKNITGTVVTVDAGNTA